MRKALFPILMLCIGFASIAKAENTDLTNIENVIYVADASVNLDVNNEVVLSICMKNTAPIRGIQFDLYLPDGVTVVKNDRGRYICALNAARLPEDDEHTLTVAEQQDGGIRFLCGSLYDENFTGNDGEIITMRVKIDDNVALGSYPVLLKNIKLTETDISKYYETEVVESSIEITRTPSGIDAMTTYRFADSPYYDLQGRRVMSTNRKGVYIKQGQKMIVR